MSFSNIIDENSNELYKGLTDKDLIVKKNTLMVLTHLILNGMIKVKGQLGEMAKCLEDPDERIADLAKLFFSELSTKENAIYNNLPDGTSRDATKSVSRFTHIPLQLSAICLLVPMLLTKKFSRALCDTYSPSSRRYLLRTYSFEDKHSHPFVLRKSKPRISWRNSASDSAFPKTHVNGETLHSVSHFSPSNPSDL